MSYLKSPAYNLNANFSSEVLRLINSMTYTTLFITTIAEGGIVYIVNCSVNNKKVKTTELLKNSFGKTTELLGTRIIYTLLVYIKALFPIGAVLLLSLLFTMFTFIIAPLDMFIVIISIILIIAIIIFFQLPYLFYVEEVVLEGRKFFSATSNSKEVVLKKAERRIQELIFFKGLIILIQGVYIYIFSPLTINQVAYDFYYVFMSIIFSRFLLFFKIPMTLKYINYKKVSEKEKNKRSYNNPQYKYLKN